MHSRIADAINLKTHPVAIIWTDEAPADAIQFRPGRWGCVMSSIANVAAKGKTAVFDRQTYGCWGGGVGLGFGNTYTEFPGGVEGFCAFLSDGNEKTEKGRAMAEAMAKSPEGVRMASDFLHGERYLKNPETVERFLKALPIQEIPTKYVCVKPLSEVDSVLDNVKSITFFVEPDALSALVVLANHVHPEVENVSVPYAAACQVMGILSYDELSHEKPRALIGLSDLSARKTVRAVLGSHVMSFTAPWPVFLAMEERVGGSFLERETWTALQGHMA
ncbi:MAG TPA: DUF169 domain-containing protein [Candidatus Acidoferrales bacterium]|nr:DUF169 domain-containing protein [Candidatus Acidoferrales bacterium]